MFPLNPLTIAIVVVVVLVVLFSVTCIKIVPQAQAAIVERLGSYLTTWNNGLHVKMAFYQDGRNLFRLENGHLEAMAQSAMAGVLRRLPEITLFLNPLPSSY